MAASRVMVPILCLCAAVFCLGLWTTAGNAYESPSPLDVSTPASSSMSFGVARDSWINADAVTANYGADKELWVGLYNQAGKTYERRALLDFDISGLPADAIVDSAGLELSQVAAYDAAQLNIWTYQVVDYWDEALVTWESSPPWASAGDLATAVDKYSGVKVWDVTKIVQSWRAGAKNYGILLVGDGKTLGTRVFASRESSAGHLIVYYHQATTPGALTLNGAGYVEIPADYGLNPAAALTVEGWIRRDLLDASCQTIAAKNGDTGYWLGVSNDQLVFRVGGQTVTSQAPLPVLQWLHVAATHDGALMRLYVDGSAAGQEKVAGLVPLNADPLHLGGDRGQCLFKGSLAHIHLWDRAFDQAEVRTRMGRSTDSQEPGLLGGWGLVGNADEIGGRYPANPVGLVTYNGPLDPAVVTWDGVLVIPHIDDQFVLDGSCQPGEYGSLRVPIWYPDGHFPPNPVYAYVGAVGNYPAGSIAICMQNVDVTADLAAVYIDPDNGGAALAGLTDYVLRALPGGSTGTTNSGDGAGNFTGPGLPDYGTRYHVGDQYGSVEFRLPRSLLPTAGATLRMAFYHEGVGTEGAAFGYPDASARPSPRTWAQFRIADGSPPRPDGGVPRVQIERTPLDTVRPSTRVDITARISDDVDLASAEIYLNGELVQTCTYPSADDRSADCPYSAYLPTRWYTVQARVIDHRGRIGNASGAPFRVDPDNAAPTVAVTHAPRVLAPGQQFTISAQASDASGLRRITILLDAPPYQADCEFSGATTQEPCSVTISPGLRSLIRYSAQATDMADFTAATERLPVVLGGAAQPGDPDSDNDGLSNSIETALSLNPNDPDTDNDALLDGWEVRGLLFPTGEFTDLPAMGANPYRKDVFVQHDYERGVRPEPGVWDRVIAAYRSAGITMHVTLNERPRPTGDWPGGISPEPKNRSNWNAEWASWHRDGAGKYYFPPKLAWTHHYVYSHHNIGSSSSWHYVTIDVNTGACPLSVADPQSDPQCNPYGRSADDQVYRLVHELGHNLGLGHGGRLGDYDQWRFGDYIQHGVGAWDSVNWKPNYISIMNYRYNRTDFCIDPSAPLTRENAVIDFQYRPMTALDETGLFEAATSSDFVADLARTACPAGMVPAFSYTCGDTSGARNIMSDGSRVLKWSRWSPNGTPGGVWTDWTIAGRPTYTTPGVDWNCDGQVDPVGAVQANVNGSGYSNVTYQGWEGQIEFLESLNDRYGLPHNPGSACAIRTDTNPKTAEALPATYRQAMGGTDCRIASATTPTYPVTGVTNAKALTPAVEIMAASALPEDVRVGPFVEQHEEIVPGLPPLVSELCNGTDDDRDALIDEDCADGDGDKVVDGLDNCPMTPNTDQVDANRDFLGDACGAPTVESLSVTVDDGIAHLAGKTPSIDVRGFNVYRQCRGDANLVRLGGYPTAEKPTYLDKALGQLPCTYTMIAVNLNGQEIGTGATAGTGVAVYLPMIKK